MLWFSPPPRSVATAVFLCGLFCSLCCFPQHLYAQEEFEVEHEWPFWLRGLVDVRIARGGKASSWTDRGPGKIRYGGRSTQKGIKRVTRIALSQLALEAGGILPWGIVPRVQLNWETDVSHDDRPLLIEAYLRKEWGDWGQGWGLQTGVMNLPFSLEHTGPASTPLYTLTPSALNTWMWEEARLVGIEAEWWRVVKETRLSILAGMGFGPDQLGHMMAVRGWILSDYMTGINSDLPLPERGMHVSVFDERDHRPAIYALITVSEPRQWGEVMLGYMDNLGDLGTAGVWETRFGTIGAALHPLNRVEVLAQYLLGTTRVRQSPCDISFSAFYALVSLHYRSHRFSARYDSFRTNERDHAPSYREDGDAVTLAYLFEIGLHHRVGFEYTVVHSHRSGSFLADPSDNGWQLSYRFRY